MRKETEDSVTLSLEDAGIDIFRLREEVGEALNRQGLTQDKPVETLLALGILLAMFSFVIDQQSHKGASALEAIVSVAKDAYKNLVTLN